MEVGKRDGAVGAKRWYWEVKGDPLNVKGWLVQTLRPSTLKAEVSSAYGDSAVYPDRGYIWIAGGTTPGKCVVPVGGANVQDASVVGNGAPP